MRLSGWQISGKKCWKPFLGDPPIRNGRIVRSQSSASPIRRHAPFAVPPFFFGSNFNPKGEFPEASWKKACSFFRGNFLKKEATPPSWYPFVVILSLCRFKSSGGQRGGLNPNRLEEHEHPWLEDEPLTKAWVTGIFVSFYT